MSEVATIVINKLDSARRQLETAALLYFNDRDIISIHTLAAAAYEVVETIAKGRGQSTLIQRSLLDFLSEDDVKAVRKAMRSQQNFLKHADRDPDGQFQFKPDYTEGLMLDAMLTYAQITGEVPSLFNAFSTWFQMQKPKVKSTPDKQANLKKAKASFGAMPRLEFLQKYLARAATIRP